MTDDFMRPYLTYRIRALCESRDGSREQASIQRAVTLREVEVTRGQFDLRAETERRAKWEFMVFFLERDMWPVERPRAQWFSYDSYTRKWVEYKWSTE